MASGRRKQSTPRPPDTATQALGRIVREQRKALRLTQDALGLQSGVGVAFLYQLEHGKETVRFDKVLAVLTTLGLALSIRLGQPDRPAGSLTDDTPKSHAAL